MALVLADRVQQTGTANTTVSFTLSGSVTGFQTFAVIGNTNTTYYAATDNSGSWEVGIGTYSTTGPTLTRTTILSSSNSGSAVTFSGTVAVFVTYPSEKSVNYDASDNVGIGTTSPVRTLDVTTANAVIRAKNTDATGSSTFEGVSDDGNSTLNARTYGTTSVGTLFGQTTANWSAIFTAGTSSNGLIVGTQTSDPLLFGTSNTERMRINAAGSVGIGTTDPTSLLTVSQGLNGSGPVIEVANTYYLATSTDERVEFQGSFYQNDVSALRAAGTVRVGKSGDFSDNANASSFMAFLTRNAGTFSEKMRITSAGNVGIGTSSPAALLHAAQSYVTPTGGISADTVGIFSKNDTANGNANLSILSRSSGYQRIYFGNQIVENGQYIESSTQGGTAAYLAFGAGTGTVAATERMRIDSSGRLLVGTTSGFVSALTVATADGAAPANTSGNNALRLRSTATAAVGAGPSILFEGQTGNTTAQFGFAAIQGFKDSAGVNDYSGAMAFYTQNSGGATSLTERMRLDSSGRLLIGTTTSTNNILSEQDLAVVAAGTGVFPGWSSVAYSGTTATAASILDIKRSRGTTDGSLTVVASGDDLGYLRWWGADGAAFIRAAQISAQVDGTPGTNDMPGRLVFSTTADGASSPTERMRIDSLGRVGIGTGTTTGYQLRLAGTYADPNATIIITGINGTLPSTNTSNAYGVFSSPSTTAASYTLSNLHHFFASQGTIGAGSAITDQYGFHANSNLTGATNNYGFYSNIPAGTGDWNFYANGTAQNYFAGNVGIGTTSPAYPLQVSTATETNIAITGGTTSETNIFFGDSGSATIGRITYNNNGDYMRFNVNAAERMRIDSSGNVGIGTSSPTAPLTVSSAAATVDGVRLYSVVDAAVQSQTGIGFNPGTGSVNPAARISALEFDASDSRASLLFYTRDSNSDVAPTERLRIGEDGRLQINGSNGLDSSLVATAHNFPLATAVTAYQFRADATFNAANTSAVGFGSTYDFPSSGTFSSSYQFFAANIPALTGTAAVTNNYGVFVAAQTVGTNIYGVSSNIDAATNRWNFYAGGTAANYFEGAVQVNGNLQFNSGYGSVATAYGCRAWVNFNGTANTNLSGTYSQSGTTVTVTATAHGLIQGNSIYADITTGTAVDGIYTVATVISSSQFTYTAGTSLTTSGNITLVRSTIRASGNVSSVADNATGDYTINFAVAMPDANYSVGGIGASSSGNSYGFMSLATATVNGTDPTTTAFRIKTTSSNGGALADVPYANVQVFR